jgi:hypothetical protein
MQRFSTRLYTLLFSFLSRGFESVALFIIDVCENQAMINHIRTPKKMYGATIIKLLFIWLILLCSSEPIARKKKNNHVSTKKIKGNIINKSTEL